MSTSIHSDVRRRPTAALLAAMFATLAALLVAPATARAGEDEITWDAPPRVPIAMFRALFPGAMVGKRPALKGVYNLFRDVNEDIELKKMTFVQTRLRGKLALIPVELSTIQRLTSKVAVVSFPIYLCASCQGYSVPESLIEKFGPGRAPHKGEFGTKLFQVSFVDTRTNTLLAKPKDFPLESPRWDTYSGSAENASIDLEISQVTGCSTCIAIRRRVYELEARRVRTDVRISAFLPWGTLTSDAREEGPGESVLAIESAGDKIVATVKHRGAEETEERIVLLRLGDDPERFVDWDFHGN